MKDLLDNPAAVRSVDDLAALAQAINAAHHAGEESTRRGLEHFRAAGEALLKAKERCGHGNWLAWLKANVKFSRMNATRYMRVANEWSKCNGALHLADALRLITDDADEEQELPADDAAVAPECQTAPALVPGFVYLCVGEHRELGTVTAEMGEHPDHPGYWVWAFIPAEDGVATMYQGRGCTMLPSVLAVVLEHFTPDARGWQELPADADIPLVAVVCDRMDREEGAGRWEWLKHAAG